MPQPTAEFVMNKFEIEMFAKRAAQNYLASGRDLNDSIFEMSAQNNWSPEQVRRVVESTNTITNGEMVRRAKTAGADPRVTFPMASHQKVASRRIAASPAALAFEETQTAKLAGYFVVPDAPFSKTAEAPPEPMRRISDLSGGEIVQAYMLGKDISGEDHTLPQLRDAADEVETMVAIAREKWASAQIEEDRLLAQLKSEVEQQLHGGLSPATLTAIINQAPAAPMHKAAAVAIVDERARVLEKKAGTNALHDKSIVDESHPLLVALHELGDSAIEHSEILNVIEKISQVRERIRADVNHASRDGSMKIAFNLNTKAIRGFAAQPIRSLTDAAKKVDNTAGKVVGAGFHVLGTAGTAMDAYHGSANATRLVRHAQLTPHVGPMKMAAVADWVKIDRGNFPKLLGQAAVAAGVLAASSKLLEASSKGVESMFEKRRRQKLFERIGQSEPSLRTNPRAREYFDLCLTYAPSLADHPLAVGDFLRKQLTYPVSSTEFLQALATLQKTVVDGRRKEPGFLQASASDIGRLAIGTLPKG